MKKIAQIAFCSMLTLGASFLSADAQTTPTGAPDTSVTSRSPRITTQSAATTPAVNTPKQQEVTEPKTTNTTVILGTLGAILIAGIAVVLIRRNKAKK